MSTLPSLCFSFVFFCSVDRLHVPQAGIPSRVRTVGPGTQTAAGVKMIILATLLQLTAPSSNELLFAGYRISEREKKKGAGTFLIGHCFLPFTE